MEELEQITGKLTTNESDFEIEITDSDQEYNQLKSENTLPYFPVYLVDFR